MDREGQAPPYRPRRAGWVLLVGVIVTGLALWNLARPSAPQDPAPPSPLPPIATATPTTLPTAAATPVRAVQDNTFVSRELVTTTLAVPLAAWTGGPAKTVALAPDGKSLAFTASTPAGDDELYRYDLATGDLTPIVTGGGWVGAPALALDGGVIAFYAWTNNLVPGDTNAVQDAFVYDHATASVARVSVGPDGAQANGRSGDARGLAHPALSGDGQQVAFASEASNLVPGDANHAADVFLHDRATGTTTRISQGADGDDANGPSTSPALSLDGNLVAFQSAATNLDPTQPALPAAGQIYLHDRAAGLTVLVSRGPDGRPGDGDSSLPALSGDGRYLVYVSAATNLVVGDTNGVDDVFLYDRVTGATRRVSVASTGTQANRASTWPTIALDGRVLAFVSAATNLVTGDGNAAADLFVHDQWARHTSRVSVAVVDQWRGREAGGPTLGPAALTVGGQLIALVVDADDLAPAGSAGVPRLYLHTRTAPPTFTLSGQVVDTGRVPLPDVAVMAGPHRTVTGPDGSFSLPYLVGGTYTLAVARPGYLFSPPRRTLSVLTDLAHQDFVGFPDASGDGWLELPFAYDGQPSTFLATLRDTDEGGLVDAWFDHDAPTYAKNGAILLWDGRPRTTGAYHTNLGCFERRCYDGHDGVDFPYRDPDATTPGVYEPITVYPAAAGRVAAVVTTCRDGGRFCNRGYGDEVLLYHDNGYFTRYSHLDPVSVDTAAGWITPETAIGVMGSTGNSYGVHLHFAVHQDDGNGLWDGDAIDLPLDPFGWLGVELDPWTATYGGPASRRLWRYSPTAEAVLSEAQPATLRDGSGAVTANLPAGTFAGQVRVELTTGAAQALTDPPRRSLGRGFRLQVLEALSAGTLPAPARPIEFAVAYVGAETRHLALDDLLLYHWQDGLGWSPLPTAVDTAAQVIYAATDRLGEFDLQAPLLCPADAHEPDDGYFAAVGMTPGDAATTRLFDLPDDEDWLQVETVAGATYTVETTTTTGVAPTAVLLDSDGLTPLAEASAGALTWTAPADGTYFVRLTPAPGSATGCDATYSVTLR